MHIIEVRPSLDPGCEVYVIGPALTVGRRVRWTERGLEGEIVKVYPNNSPGLWYGTQRRQYTHCYQVWLDSGLDVWGLVDATVEPLAQG